MGTPSATTAAYTGKTTYVVDEKQFHVDCQKCGTHFTFPLNYWALECPGCGTMHRREQKYRRF